MYLVDIPQHGIVLLHRKMCQEDIRNIFCFQLSEHKSLVNRQLPPLGQGAPQMSPFV